MLLYVWKQDKKNNNNITLIGFINIVSKFKFMSLLLINYDSIKQNNVYHIK